jgi:hypothetical protein
VELLCYVWVWASVRMEHSFQGPRSTSTFDPLYLVCAGAGGAQVQALQHPGIWATLRGTMVEEGVAGLYRGCAPTLLVSCSGFPSIVNMFANVPYSSLFQYCGYQGVESPG